MTNLDDKKIELEVSLRDAILAGDVSEIVRIESNLKTLEIQSFASHAKRIKDEIADCISRKQELERDKENLAPERWARVEKLTAATKTMHEAEYELNRIDAVLFSIDGTITNCREELRGLKEELNGLMESRFGREENEKTHRNVTSGINEISRIG